MGTPTASSVPPEQGMGGGISPSGKVKPLPGSYETTARTFRLLIAVIQPNPPPREWVTITPGPILSNNATTASAITPALKGPVSGVIWRKNWFRDSASRGNCAWEKVRPDAEPEQGEPVLIIGHCGDTAGQRAAARTTPAGLIDVVYAESPSQDLPILLISMSKCHILWELLLKGGSMKRMQGMRFDPKNSQEVRTVYILCKKNMFIDTVGARTDDQ